uniref:Uncharacterized protein n=1 Tax=Cajanus cajan TaxID=3821 RepID=A0A151T3Z3_CAJCA|nr:hypothetical protein KK1_016269 [Cajanus cajan]
MGHLHLSKMKFRHPIPDTCEKFNIDSQQQHRKADSDGHACSESRFWMSFMVPSEWMWSLPNKSSALSNDEAHCPKCQSTYELEGDTSVDGLSGFIAIPIQTHVHEHIY